MTQLAGVFAFAPPGDPLWVNEQVLGREVKRTFRGRPVRLRIAAPDDQFGLEGQPLHKNAFGDLCVGNDWWVFGAHESSPTESACAVKVLQVAVYENASFGSVDFQGDTSTWPKDAATSLLQELSSTAEAFVKRFLEHARFLLAQYWVCLSVDAPHTIISYGLTDTETRERIPILVAYGKRPSQGGLDTNLTETAFEKISDQAGNDVEVPLPEELLADARYLAWTREPPDLRRAVLLAATACESKLKRTLSDLAEDRQKDLLTLVLLQSDLSLIDHFDKTVNALVGRSLKKERKNLYKSAQHLFKKRNNIAHGDSDELGHEEMANAVKTAVDLYSWVSESLANPIGD